MASESPQPLSFSTRRRWVIFFSVVISIVTVIALVGMINYLGGRHFLRFSWNSRARAELSPQTVNLLKSITNHVHVVMYFKKDAPLYSLVSSLLNEYQMANRNISIETVDYLHDPAGAKKIKDKYNKYGFTSMEDKNLVIFEANGVQFVHGDLLGDFKLETVPNAEEREFKNVLKGFKGEGVFNSALVSVASTQPQHAYFLVRHGEHRPDLSDNSGYLSFAKILPQNYVQPHMLDLAGTNAIPTDCRLLIIPGPTQALLPSEVEKLRQYLARGGKMFVLLNSDEVINNINTGLEGLLAEWGVDVGRNYIKDPTATTSESGYDLIVTGFNEGHPVVNPLLASRLRLMLPRSVGKLETGKQGAEAPKVEVLAWTGEKALINNSVVPTGKPVPLIVAVEKGAIKGVYTETGTTRIVVTGDSLFLNNQLIEMDRNREFAVNALNWLLDRTQLLQGIGPRPVTEFRFLMTKPQMKSVQWLLLAGLPGVILLLGGLVWLRRRH